MGMEDEEEDIISERRKSEKTQRRWEGDTTPNLASAQEALEDARKDLVLLDERTNLIGYLDSIPKNWSEQDVAAHLREYIYLQQKIQAGPPIGAELPGEPQQVDSWTAVLQQREVEREQLLKTGQKSILERVDRAMVAQQLLSKSPHLLPR